MFALHSQQRELGDFRSVVFHGREPRGLQVEKGERFDLSHLGPKQYRRQESCEHVMLHTTLYLLLIS